MAKTPRNTAKLPKQPPMQKAPHEQPAPGVIIQQLDDILLDLKRRYAAYNLFVETYHAITQPSGGRRRGLPIFNFKASVDGVHALDLCLDLREVSADELPTVLGAFARAQGNKLRLAAEQLAHNTVALCNAIAAAIPASDHQAADEPDDDEPDRIPADEEEEEEEEDQGD